MEKDPFSRSKQNNTYFLQECTAHTCVGCLFVKYACVLNVHTNKMTKKNNLYSSYEKLFDMCGTCFVCMCRLSGVFLLKLNHLVMFLYARVFVIKYLYICLLTYVLDKCRTCFVCLCIIRTAPSASHALPPPVTTRCSRMLYTYNKHWVTYSEE